MAANQTEKRILILLLVFIPFLFINQILDNDIWFLLNSGRFVMESGFPTVEPFTIHEGFSFVLQQWLTAVVFWTVYSKLGIFGLFALVLVIYGLIIFVTFKCCLLISENNFLVSYAITMLISFLISFMMVTRPYIISAFIFTLEAFCLESFIKKGKKRYLFALPLLSLLEINAHAAMWPMLFVILIPYWIDSFRFRVLFIKGQGYPKKALLAVTVLMLAAGFANPYGFDAMTYLFKSYGYPEISRLVQEMLPANINTAFGLIIFGSMFALILIYALYQKGSSRLRYILLTLGMAFLALSSVRGFLFFAIFGWFPVSYFLRGFGIKEKKPSSARRQTVLKIVLLVLICMGSVFGFIKKYNQTANFTSDPDGAGAVDYLSEHADPETVILYTHYDVGGYAEYMGFKCYLDPRAEVFVKKNNGKADIMLEFYQLQEGKLYYGDFLQKYDFTHLLVPRNDLLYVYLPKDPDYRIVYEDDEYRLFERWINN